MRSLYLTPYLLLFTFFITSYSCISTGNKNVLDKIEKAQTKKSEKTINNKNKNSDLTAKYTFLPNDLQTYLNEEISDWEIPDTSEYVKYWWFFNDKNKNSLFVNTDLNNDGLEDYALIFKKDNELKIAIILKAGKSFTHWIAEDFNESYTGKDLIYGIYYKKPGRTDCVVNGNNVSLVIDRPSIELRREEIMTRIYYVKDGQFKIFNTI